MKRSKIDITTGDGVADAYLTQPDDDHPHPAVLFVMDAIGLRPRIEEMADRIAARGYVVLAPNFFYRSGRAPVLPVPDLTDPDNRAGFMQSIRPMIGQLTPENINSDGAAYLDLLGEQASGPVGNHRLLHGRAGGLATRRRVSGPGRSAGRLSRRRTRDRRSRQPAPVRRRDLTAELYFGHADQDPSMTTEQIEALDLALDDAGVSYRAEVYEGAHHGYTMSDTAAFNEAACERHFAELFALLDRTLAPA